MRASFSIRPQLAAGGCMPRPRYDSEASTTTARANVIEACTITLPSRLGTMCRKTITGRRVPSAREASTYSSVLMT